MRQTNEVVEIVDSVKKSAIATQEEIVYYIVDKKTKSLDVMVEMSNDQKEVVKTERYSFTNIDKLGDLSEGLIWELIDGQRKSDILS